MKLLSMLGCPLAVVALMVSVPFAARASDADILREAKDRADIQALMWRYVRALDTQNEDAYADVFTPDGQFASGANAAKGREALKKMVADVRKSRAEREAKAGEKIPPMHHVITNATIEFLDKDHALFHSYWMTVMAGSPGKNEPRVAAAGRGIDDLVRVDGKWLIKSRNVAPQD